MLRFFFFAAETDKPVSPLAVVLSWGAVLLLVSALFTFAFGRLQYEWHWSAIAGYRSKFFYGWLMTVAVAAASLTVSLLIGIVAALSRRSSFLPLRYAALLYVELIRGTPLLVQVMLFFYVIADAFGMQNRYLAGILTLSIFSGAYMAEMIRSGIESISTSQLDACRAIGLSKSQSYRYVIVPQMLRQLLPPLSGQFASIIKDSSLLSIIAVNELTLSAQEINSYTYSTLESYLPLALGYLILTLPISLCSRTLERKFHYAT